MIKLNFKGKAQHIDNVVVGKIIILSEDTLVCTNERTSQDGEDTIILTSNPDNIPAYSEGKKIIFDIADLHHIHEGDIVSIHPNGQINSLFRSKSIHNSLFITDRCNSNCLMCSQPPKNKDDLDYFYEINSQLVKLIPTDTKELGITGGEPTLLGERYITLLEDITENLPQTDVHILTNGRAFAWKNIPEAISKVNNPKMMFGIPLYSDYYLEHDYVVQAKNAFNHTVLGFHNMARYGLRLELRIVVHKQTYKRLPSLAKFIYKNLPFVEHIAFMGLEYTGYTPYNNDKLWIEPSEYMDQLEEAAFFLDEAGMNVSIYNLQLCLIKPTLWKFSRNSISDWKKDYLDECSQCKLLNECGGIFATSKKYSNEIKAILI